MVVCLLEVASGVANGGRNFLSFLNMLTDRRGLLKDASRAERDLAVSFGKR